MEPVWHWFNSDMVRMPLGLSFCLIREHIYRLAMRKPPPHEMMEDPA